MSGIDSIAITTSCDDAKQLAQVAGQKIVDEGIKSIKEGPSKTAADYKVELENFVRKELVHSLVNAQNDRKNRINA